MDSMTKPSQETEQLPASLDCAKAPVNDNSNTLRAREALELANEEAVGVNEDSETIRPIHGWKWAATCIAIYTSGLLYGLDTTITADVQPNIVKSLGGIQKLAWIGAEFPLGSVALILPIGFAYGLFETKKLYLASIILFEAGSALCGGAPSINALIVGRVVAGAGGAGSKSSISAASAALA